jgi:hypothetical protein
MKMNKLEEITAIKFYKKIYNKACNSFWTIRIIYALLAFFGIAIFSITVGTLISTLLFSKKMSLMFFLILIVISIIMLLPFSFCIYRNMKIKKRSRRYENYLVSIKEARRLDNQSIDLLLENIDNLRYQKKMERDYLIKLFIKVCKWAIFPLTAVLFKVVTEDVGVTLLLATFIFSMTASFFLAAWNDFETLDSIKSMGIKNDYVLSIAKTELKYMKEID